VEYSGGNKEELYDKHRQKRIRLLNENHIEKYHKHNREKLLNYMKTSDI